MLGCVLLVSVRIWSERRQLGFVRSRMMLMILVVENYLVPRGGSLGRRGRSLGRGEEGSIPTVPHLFSSIASRSSALSLRKRGTNVATSHGLFKSGPPAQPQALKTRFGSGSLPASLRV
jgi:hypothetical protein